MTALRIVPVGFKEAKAFVGIEHRHNKRVVGSKFVIGVALGNKLVGVAIIARTTARALHASDRAEITRCCTDGTPNACSKLYERARRICQLMGYVSCKTYTRTDESGASLRAIAACCEKEIAARSWKESSKKRTREDKSEPHARYRWELLPGVAT